MDAVVPFAVPEAAAAVAGDPGLAEPQLIQYIHLLREKKVADGLFQDLEREKYMSLTELAHILKITCGLSSVDSVESSLETDTRALLEDIQQRVYDGIGPCPSLNGSFSELLDSLSISATITKDLGSMEVRRLRKLIHHVAIPLVWCCPPEFGKKWAINFVQPMLGQCKFVLHSAWFDHLYKGQAEVPCLSEFGEETEELKQKLLLDFTREVSEFLEVLAITEQNWLQDLESMPSFSLFRFLLTGDWFDWLDMGLFGYFVDDESTSKAIPFLRSLIHLATTNDISPWFFIVDDLLPCIVRRLDSQLKCAIQCQRHKLNSGADDSVGKDLTVLCQQLYDYLLIQDFSGEGKDNCSAENSFIVWMEKQKKFLQVKASSASKKLPEGCEWNWEFEDEFQRYLHVYMKILQEVNAMDDCTERDYLEKKILFEKLKLEFRNKLAINSYRHPYMVTISSFRQQQFYTRARFTRNMQICKFVSELVKLKPYIKVSDCSYDVIQRVKGNSETLTELSDCDVAPSVDLLLHSVLYIWEPRFHPLIRESHLPILLGIINRLTTSNEVEHCQQLVPVIGDFPSHLQLYAYEFVDTKLRDSMYYTAVEQISLHKEFDNYLASGELDHCVDEFMSSKDEFVENLIRDESVVAQFSDLNHALMKLSLERRADIVKNQQQICIYSECLRRLFENESLKGRIKMLINVLKTEGFFDMNDDFINWDKKCFSDLVNEFNEKVFAGQSLPKHYVIRGIIDCRLILMRKGSSWRDTFEEVVDEACERWIENREEYWMDTRYYEHHYYDIVRRPLEQVFSMC